MITAASCPKPDGGGLVKTSSHHAGRGTFSLLKISFWNKTVDLTAPYPRLFFQPPREKTPLIPSLPEAGTTLHLIISSPSRYISWQHFENCEMGKIVDLTRHAGFIGNPITSSGKNLPKMWDSVSDIPCLLRASHFSFTMKLSGVDHPAWRFSRFWYSAFFSDFPLAHLQNTSRTWRRGTPTQSSPTIPHPHSPCCLICMKRSFMQDKR